MSQTSIGAARVMGLEQTAELSEGYGNRLAFSGDNRTWASAQPGWVHLWEADQLKHDMILPAQPIGRIGFIDDGRRLFVGPLLFTVPDGKTVDLPSLRDSLVGGIDPQAHARPEQFVVNGSSWSPEGDQLVVATGYRPPRGLGKTSDYSGPRSRLLLFSGQSRDLLRILWEGDGIEDYHTIAINTRFIAAGSLSIRVWDRTSHEQIAELFNHTHGIQDIRFNADGTRLASASSDGIIALWDTTNWSLLEAWQGHDEGANTVAFHPTLPVLASGGADANLKLWSLAPRSLIASTPLPERVEAIAFSPNGQQMIVATRFQDEKLFVYRVIQ